MEKMHFQYQWVTPMTVSEVFVLLLNPKNWWIGLYEEIIEGKSEIKMDEFSFRAGNGVHYSNHRLIELEPNEKIAWLVTESHLSFLDNPNEWAQTTFGFEMKTLESQTKITFFHQGLVPSIACYDRCSNAWSQYLRNLERALNK